MPAYVERDADWVLRPTGHLLGAQMHVFAFSAGADELREMCATYVDGPTSGAITAEPLFESVPFALLVCADIAKGYSSDRDDRQLGWMPERDVAWFVPVRVRQGRRTFVANLLPYIFVDNPVAVLIGREVFGFPKVHAEMWPAKNPFSWNVMGTVKETSDPQERAETRHLLQIKSVVQRAAIPLSNEMPEAIAATVSHFAKYLQVKLPSFVGIPLLFLKQFRDVSQRTRACHQSITFVSAAIDAVSSAAVLTDDFELTMPRYHSARMAEKLGLPHRSSAVYRPLAAVRANLDFSIPFGQSLWTAP